MKTVICKNCGKIIKPMEIRETNIDQYGRPTYICSKCADWWEKYGTLIFFTSIFIIGLFTLFLILNINKI